MSEWHFGHTVSDTITPQMLEYSAYEQSIEKQSENDTSFPADDIHGGMDKRAGDSREVLSPDSSHIKSGGMCHHKSSKKKRKEKKEKMEPSRHLVI